MKFNTKKIATLTLAFILSLGVLSGCGNKEEKSSGNKGNSIVYGISTAPTGIFNPLINDSVYDDAVCKMVYSSLLDLNDKQELSPSLAEKFEVSADKLSLTFTIKENVKWSDGKPLTSDDVSFTLYSLASKKYAGELGDYVSKIKGVTEFKDGKSDKISGIETPDSKTIKITFTEPYGPALTNIGTLGIIPKHIWKDIDESKWKESKEALAKPVGSGPFKVVSFTEGQDVKLEKNKDYFKGEPKSDNIILKVVSEDTVAADLKNGSVDIADVSNIKKADREDLEKADFKLNKHANNLFQYMGINYRNSIFKDLKVRQAMIYAIDRDSMVKKILEGNGKVTNVPLLSSSWAYPENDKNINDYKYNVEKAKSLLKEAGYVEKDGVMTNSKGEKLQFKLDVPTGNTTREQTAEIIQQNLKDVGIKIDLNKMEFKALMQKVVANHDFDLYMMGNNLPADPDLTAYWSSESVSNEKGKMGWNIAGFATPELDGILKEGASTFDIEKRKESYKKFGEYMNKELPWIYLFEQDIVVASSSKVKGFEPSVFRDFADSEKWSITK